MTTAWSCIYALAWNYVGTSLFSFVCLLTTGDSLYQFGRDVAAGIEEVGHDTRVRQCRAFL